MDLKLELAVVPVTDVDRARDLQTDRVGFHVDLDQGIGEVQDLAWGRFLFFHEPNGNGRIVQQIRRSGSSMAPAVTMAPRRGPRPAGR